MPTFSEIRDSFPGARDLSDEEILKRISDLTKLPIHQVADDFGYDVGSGGKNAKRLSASIDQYQSNLYGVGEDVTKAAGLTGASEFLGRQRQRNAIQADVASGRAHDMGSVDSWADVHGPRDFADYATGLGIQSLPYAAEAIVGGAVGGATLPSTFARMGLAGERAVEAARMAGVVAGSYPSSVGDILQNQREQTGGQTTDLLSAAALGVPYAAANVFGIEGTLGRGQLFRNGIKALDEIPGIRGAAARTGSSMLRTGAEEGGNETFQEFMNQAGRMTVDPSQSFSSDDSNNRFYESGVGGAVLGALTAGVAGGWRRSHAYTVAPTNLLPDATPQETTYTTPGSLTNTPVTDMPGFASQQQDPLQQQIGPLGDRFRPMQSDVGPSVTPNPNPPGNPPPTPPAGAAPGNPPTNAPGRVRGKQQTEEPPVSPQERQDASDMYRVESVLDDGTDEGHWRVFGKDFFNRADLNNALDKQAIEDRGDNPAATQLAKQLNAAGPAISRPKALKALAASLVGSTPEKTAYNLDAAIKGGIKDADRLAAVYEEITGNESPAWKALQQPTAAKEKAPAATATTQPSEAANQPTAFADDDFEGMARATLMKLFNGNETNTAIALADLRGDKPADIQKQYGVSDSQVRKIRSRLAPKALEIAARQAGVPLEKLGEAFAKREAGQTTEGETRLEEGTDEKPMDSDERPLHIASDEELSQEQQEADTHGTAGMSLREGTGAQIADASTRNNSRAKLEAVHGKLSDKSITVADLNNLYIAAVEADDRKLANDVEREVLRRHKAGELSAQDLEDLDHATEDADQSGSTDLPAGARTAEAAGRRGEPAAQGKQNAAVRKEAAAGRRETAAGQGSQATAPVREAAGKKQPKGKVGTAWDKLQRQLAAAKVEMPAWESLTPEQQTKATDQFALNGKIGVQEAQKVVGTSPAATPTVAPKIDEKSAATVAKIRRSTAPSTKEATGADLMAKLNKAAEEKKGKPDANMIYGGQQSALAHDADRAQNLKVAIQMSKAGEAAEKIHLATGWFKNPHDGKWRYEIADNRARLNGWDKVETSKLFGEAHEYPLNVVLDHPELFEMYPKAREIKVMKRAGLLDFGGLQGWFDGKNSIGITPYAKDPLSTLLHEVQHWIQRQEGFATGGNENMVWEAMTPEQKHRVAEKVMPKLEESIKEKGEELRSLELANDIKDWPEAQAAREAEKRWGEVYKLPDKYLKDGGKESDPEYQEYVKQKDEALEASSRAVDALTNRVAEKLGIKPTPYFPGSKIMRIELEYWQRLAMVHARNYMTDLAERITSAKEDVVSTQKTLAAVRSGDEAALQEAIKKSGEGYNLYRAIAGEIEARDTQARQNLTDKERKGKTPLTSEDIDPKDVIVTYDQPGESNSQTRRLSDVIKKQEAEDKMTGTGVPRGWAMVEAEEPDLTPEDRDRSYGHAVMEDFGFDHPQPATVVDDIKHFFMAHMNTRTAGYLLGDAGIGNLMKGLDGLMVVEDEKIGDTARGMYLTYVSGTKKLAIAASQLREDNPNGTFVLLHEIGHSADLAGTHYPGQKGFFSGRAELQFHIDYMGEKRTLIPLGAVANELHALWKQDSPRWNFLSYPFDLEEHGRLKLHNVQREVFAQLFAAYMVHPEQMKVEAPLAYRFMQRAIEDIKARNYEKALRKAKAHAGYANNSVERSAIDDGRAGFVSEAHEGGEAATLRPGQAGRQAAGRGREGRAQAGRQAERFIEALPQASRTGARKLWTTISDAAKKGFYGAAFTWDLADLAANKLPSVTNYMTLMGKKSAVKTALEDQVEKILAHSEKIPKTDRLGRQQTGTGEHSINKFLYDSTLSGKWGYQDDPASNIRVDPELAARFQNFSDDAQALIRTVFKYGADTLRMKQRIIKDEINNEYRALARESGNDPEKLEELERKRRAALQHYDSILFLTANKPYSPLRRFGNYVTIARSQQFRDAMASNDSRGIERMQSDENHYHVSFHETLGEAEEVANRLKATGSYADTSAFEKEKGLAAIHGGRDMMTAFQRLRNLIKSELETDPNDQVAKSLNGMISDLYLQTLAETSARKAEIKRRNVAGADLDMLRAFATQGRADAHFIAALKHNGEVTDSMYEMRREAHEPGDDKAERMRLFNEFMARHALHMDYRETRVQDAILRGTSLWMLATSPAYYLQNATQTPMISVPYLAGKHGYGRSWGAVMQAFKDLGPMSRGLNWADRMDLTRAPADVQRMLNDLVSRGSIDIALDQDLGRFQSRADSSLAHGWNVVDRKLRGMAQRVEAINRVTAAISAYRMELARNGGNHAAATDYAAKVVRVTHGDYSSFNAPRYLTPGGGLPAAKVLTQFRKFQIIQASLIVRLFNNAFGGSVSPQERAVARKALFFTLGHTAAIGGMYGLPGVTTLAWVVAKLFGDPDEPDDDELKLRRMIGNEDISDLILKGAPAYFGVDLSGKLGMGNSFGLMPYTKLDTGKTSDDYKNALLGLSGPFLGGILPRFADGVDMIGRGNWYKGMEQMLPSGFANVAKSYRYATEGVTRKSGDTMMEPEEVSTATEMMQALGLQTKQLTDRSFDQKVVSEFEQFYKDKTNRLTEKYARAAKKGDTEGMQDAREQWMELQESRLKNGFPRQPLSTLLKAPVEQAKRERQVVNHVGAGRASRQLAGEMAGI
jgi:hypothetical protein